MLKGKEKYISRYLEKDLVQILKDSGYHSEEWEEMDSDAATSIFIYNKWWRSPAICIFIIISFTLSKYNVKFIYLFKLCRLLHERIDPTVELLRKKQPNLR